MSAFPYHLTGPIGARSLGLVVLRVDETVEQDFRRMFADAQTALYVSRVPSGDDLTPDTIATMEQRLPQAAALLPPGTDFDVIGYACTSGSAQIGADRVARLIGGQARCRAVSDPLSASITALRALGVTRPGIVSPYVPQVVAPILSAFAAAGLKVAQTLSFGERVEARVARIAPGSICEAATDLASRGNLDGVFLSCTNLRTLDIIERLEADLGIPVVSSNQALAWHMDRLSAPTGRSRIPALIPGRLGAIG